MSISVGETVEAEVTRVENYGLYLQFLTLEIIVLIPDVSYVPIPRLKNLYKPGDRVRVRIVEYVASESLYKGAIKDAEARATHL